MKRNLGFSMIEMLAVVALVAIMAGVSVAGVGRLGRYKATTDLGRFNSFLKFNFTRAVRNGEYMRIAVDMESGAYWAEKSDTPFFLSTGEKAEKKKKEDEELIERMENKLGSDPFKDGGSALGMEDIIQKARLMSSDELDNSDYFNYENFIPDRRSLKKILQPEYETVSEQKKISDGLIVTAFFAYHTPEIVTKELILDKELDKNVYIYIFPQGRIEPFYLSLGEESDDGDNSFAYITTDMFLNAKIKPGGFEEEVEDMSTLLEDEDAEGKK
ncbi:MAG: pilus assembly FimT family protein [bacterium]